MWLLVLWYDWWCFFFGFGFCLFVLGLLLCLFFGGRGIIFFCVFVIWDWICFDCINVECLVIFWMFCILRWVFNFFFVICLWIIVYWFFWDMIGFVCGIKEIIFGFGWYLWEMGLFGSFMVCSLLLWVIMFNVDFWWVGLVVWFVLFRSLIDLFSILFICDFDIFDDLS